MNTNGNSWLPDEDTTTLQLQLFEWNVPELEWSFELDWNIPELEWSFELDWDSF